jgi:hypothetical protein
MTPIRVTNVGRQQFFFTADLSGVLKGYKAGVSAIAAAGATGSAAVQRLIKEVFALHA